jgi:hypothetical protein
MGLCYFLYNFVETLRAWNYTEILLCITVSEFYILNEEVLF